MLLSPGGESHASWGADTVRIIALHTWLQAKRFCRALAEAKGASRGWAAGFESQDPINSHYPCSWRERVGITSLPWQHALLTGNSVHSDGSCSPGWPASRATGPCRGCDAFHWSVPFLVLTTCPGTTGFLAGLRGSGPSGIVCPWPGRGRAAASPTHLASRGLMWPFQGNGTRAPWTSQGSAGHKVPWCPLLTQHSPPRWEVVPDTHSLGQRALGGGSPHPEARAPAWPEAPCFFCRTDGPEQVPALHDGPCSSS